MPAKSALTIISLIAFGYGLAGCAVDLDAESDGLDDSFVGNGKADWGIEDGTPEAAGVLRVANQLDYATLDAQVKLASNAAHGIVTVRLGNDGLAGTTDDVTFATLQQLDNVPYVGPFAASRMLAYAQAAGWIIPDNGATGWCSGDACSALTLINTPGAPAARSSHVAVWTGTEMIVWGGGNSHGYLGSGGRYNPATRTWTSISTVGAPSRGQTAVWTGSEMIVWGVGGVPEHTMGARYNPVTDTWTPISTVAAPSIRGSHTVVWTGTEMIVWGGWYTAYQSSGARYSPATDTWTPLPTTGAPQARARHTAVWTGSEMIVWGGVGGAGPALLNTGSRYNPATNTWTPVSTSNAPVGRRDNTAVWTGEEMIVWGGFLTDPLVNTLKSGARYSPVTDTWVATSAIGAPSHHSVHSAVWTGSEMIVWGGYPILNTGARFDPFTNTWFALPAAGEPAGRYNHTAVWTGTAMIVWGGYSSSSGLFFNNGNTYRP